mmetsp:Transcript_25934/g.58179  ORF Transcript_25934/g.58179 Transcript_25934/m.58179 type:complete len:205 (+) Transcript_25934:539-1153(+)
MSWTTAKVNSLSPLSTTNCKTTSLTHARETLSMTLIPRLQKISKRRSPLRNCIRMPRRRKKKRMRDTTTTMMIMMKARKTKRKRLLELSALHFPYWNRSTTTLHPSRKVCLTDLVESCTRQLDSTDSQKCESSTPKHLKLRNRSTWIDHSSEKVRLSSKTRMATPGSLRSLGRISRVSSTMLKRWNNLTAFSIRLRSLAMKDGA